jgi:hypothetical protein
VSYLVDTNVISEAARKRPERRVIDWLESIDGDALHLSVLSVGEIRKGVESLADGRRKEELRRWLEHDLARWFEKRLLPVNLAVAERWGRLLAKVRRPVPAIDSLLAATALAFDLRFVTRNAADFDFPGLEVVNPWDS